MYEREPVLVGSRRSSIRRRHGVQLRPRTTSASGQELGFEDGSRLAFDAVIWATGFGVDHSWIDAPVFDEAGSVIQRRGVTAAPGLYFLGLSWQHTRGSALLGWVGADAEYLAGRIAARRPAAVPVRQGG